MLESEISGQTMIKVLVENAKGSVGFSAELRPRNFYGDEREPVAAGPPADADGDRRLGRRAAR